MSNSSSYITAFVNAVKKLITSHNSNSSAHSDLFSGKSDTGHKHTKSEITDFPSSITPSSHTHGNISNDGKVGTAANKPLITGNNGVIQASSFGTSANTFCQGNDSRLSDARTPTSHAHGSLANGGTLNSDITSVNKVAVTDSNNNLKTITKVPFTNLNISKDNITGLGIPSSDTVYTHPSYTSKPAGLYRITIDSSGHVSSASTVAVNYSNGVLAVTY